MGAGDTPAASMFGDALGGNVRVMSPQGVPVGLFTYTRFRARAPPRFDPAILVLLDEPDSPSY